MNLRPHQKIMKKSISNIMYAAPGFGKSCAIHSMTNHYFDQKKEKNLIPQGLKNIYSHNYNIIFFETKNKKYFYYPKKTNLHTNNHYSILKMFVKNHLSIIKSCLKNKNKSLLFTTLLNTINIDLNPYIDLCQTLQLHPNKFKEVFNLALSHPSHSMAYQVFKLKDEDVSYILDNMMAHESRLKTRQLSKKLLKLLILK